MRLTYILAMASSLILSGCVTNGPMYKAELAPIIKKPQYTAEEVKELCKPEARIAARQAVEEHKGDYHHFSCSGGGGMFSCGDNQSIDEAFSEGFDMPKIKKRAFYDAMAVCAAKYGYKIEKVCVSNCKE